MGIVCSICHKKQSGFFDDYPLSPDCKNMRICVTCQTNIQTIEDATCDEDANEALAYFEKFLSQGASPEARNRIDVAVRRRAGEVIEMSADDSASDKNSQETSEDDKENIDWSLDGLYTDIGRKIKNWAKWIFIIEAILSVIGGIIMLITGEEDYLVAGIVTLLLGPFAAFVSSWILYGFGELIDKTCANERHTAEILRFLQENNKK